MMIRREFSVSDDKAAKIGLFIIIPVVLIINVAFFFTWRENLHIINDYYIQSKLIDDWWYKMFKMILPFIIFMGGMLVHEFLHFLPLLFFSRNGIKGIKFGFNKKSLVLYTSSTEPIKAYQYMIVTLMPTILLGFLPLIVSFIYGFPWLWMFAFTSVIAGTGDFISFYYLTKVGKNELVVDNPTKIGFNIVEL